MRAALLRAPGSLAVEDVPEPDCPEGGLLIKVDACSICASDIKMFRVGHRDLAYPRILGHEVTGTILESSSRQLDLEEGTRVQVWPGMACGRCPQCLRGNDTQCSSLGILGFNRDGGFAERMAVAAECVQVGGAVPIPDDTPSDLASLTEPLACCVNAQEALRVSEGDSVLVIGAGPLGALHLLLARQRGASSTIVVEKQASRCEAISKAYPDLVINSVGAEAYSQVMESNGGRGVDVVILATPEVPINDELMNVLAPRGRLCIFSGLPRTGSHSSIDLNLVHYLERTIVGAYGCRSSDDRTALRLLSTREVEAGWLITKRVPLERIEEGLRHAAEREGMKATVTEFN
jgi:L-iditol 2-dehydrogenase